jgi:hypothetical protein
MTRRKMRRALAPKRNKTTTKPITTKKPKSKEKQLAKRTKKQPRIARTSWNR